MTFRPRIDIFDVDSTTSTEFCDLTNRVLGTSYPPSCFHIAQREGHLVFIYKVAVVAGRIVGGIRAYSITSGPGSTSSSRILPFATYIDTLVVDPHFQHQGIGGILVELVEQISKELFIHELQLHTPSNNYSAIQWYVESHGYTHHGTSPNFYADTPLDSSQHCLDAVLLHKLI